MKIISLIVISLLLSVTIISAMDITFFYSDGCKHCQRIKPLMFDYARQSYKGHWNLYETSNEDNREAYLNYNFTGVPAFVIKTNDGREIKFVGANLNKLHCELQEMTTMECPTYYNKCIDGSWFKI